MLCCFCTLIFREVFLRDALKTFLRDYLGIFPNMGRGVFPIPKTCYTKQNSPLINKIKKKFNQNFVFEQGVPKRGGGSAAVTCRFRSDGSHSLSQSVIVSRLD